MRGTKPGAKVSRFIIFRLTSSKGGALKPGYLGEDGIWTHFRSRARMDTLPVMKALVDKLKRKYPDLILEEVRN